MVVSSAMLCQAAVTAHIFSKQLLQSQQTQNILKIFVQRRTNVFDVGPTLNKCYKNGLCLLGYGFSQKNTYQRVKWWTSIFISQTK